MLFALKEKGQGFIDLVAFIAALALLFMAGILIYNIFIVPNCVSCKEIHFPKGW